MTEQVEHPDHYRAGGYECLDVWKALRSDWQISNYTAALDFNVFKYLWRWAEKGGVQDLKKARVYLEQMILDLDPDDEQEQKTPKKPKSHVVSMLGAVLTDEEFDRLFKLFLEDDEKDDEEI